MAIKKFKIEASEQAKQLAKKSVKASDGEWDKAVVSFIDSIPTLPEQGKVISKKYKGFPVVIVGLGDGKCLYNGYTRANDAASDVQFIRGLIKRGESPEKATANLGFKTYTRGEVEGACGGKKSVKAADISKDVVDNIKEYITDFYDVNYGVPVDFSDMSNIPISFAYEGKTDKLLAQVVIDAVNAEIAYVENGKRKTIKKFADLDELWGYMQKHSFDDYEAMLVGTSDVKAAKSSPGKKRWGLYSDFGQRLLNETFDSKREAQKAFREYGYTKDSEAWIEEVDETAVGKFDKKPANSACGGKKSVKGGRDKLKARKDWAVDVASRYSLFNGKNGDIENSNNKAELIRKCKAMSDPAWVEDNMLSGIIYNNDAQSDVDNADNPNYKPKKKSVKSSVRNPVHKTIKAADEWGYDFDDFDDLPDNEEDTTSSPFGLPDDYAKKWAKHGDKGPTAYFQIKVDTKRKLDEIDKMIDQVDGLDWITSWYDGLEGPDPGERYFILEYTPYTTKEALQKLYDIAEQFGGTAKNITVDGVQPIKSSNVFSDRGSEGRKWVNTELTKDEWAKLRGYLKSKGYKFEPSAAGDLIHVECFLNDKEVAEVDAFIDTLDGINSAEKSVKCSKRSRSVKASAAAKRRAKQRIVTSMPDLEDIVMYFDHNKIYEGDGSGLTAAVEELCKDDEIKAKFVEWCNQFGDPIAFESGDAHDTAFAFAWLVDTIRYEELDKFYIDGDGILDFEVFNKSDEITGAKKPVTCSEDGPLCVCDSCLAGIESHEGRQIIYDEIYSDADYGEPPLICDWCGDEVEKLYQITPGERIESAEQSVKASKYYQITDRNNDEVGQSDIEDEARELAKKLLRENNEDQYDLWWVDTDPDSTDEDVFIDTIYADKPFSVEGYYEANFRGLSDSDTFYELRDALEYAQELLGKGLSVRLECENAGGRVEITPDEYDEFMATDPEYFEDLPKLAEWISDVQVERMDSRQEPWLDNWQYNTDIGMSTKAVRASEDDVVFVAFSENGDSYAYGRTYEECVRDLVESIGDIQVILDDGVYIDKSINDEWTDFNAPTEKVYETAKKVLNVTDYFDEQDVHASIVKASEGRDYYSITDDRGEQVDMADTEDEAFEKATEYLEDCLEGFCDWCEIVHIVEGPNGEAIEDYIDTIEWTDVNSPDIDASTNVKAAIGNKNKTDYGSNPIYELDKYVKDLAEGVAAAAGITLTYQVSDEAITFIDGDGTAVFIQPISEITPEPDDLENDIQELVSAIQYSDMDNSEYWPEDTAENDPDYATRAVQMSVDDDLEPVMGEGEDVGFGIDSNGETIDESTVSELYRIAEKEILPNTELAKLDPDVSIDEDSWDFYFGGISNNGMMGVVKFYFHFKLTSDNIDLNEYVLPDAKLYPDFNYYKASLDFDIYTENGKVTDVVLESADIYKSDNSYDSHFSGKFGEAFNTEALENYIEKLAAPAAEEIYNAVSNL